MVPVYRYVVFRRGEKLIARLRVPERPYQNLEVFRQKMCKIWRPSKAEDPNFWPCDPKSRPCPVEGSRDRPRIDCRACQGSGQGNRRGVEWEYKRSIEQWRHEKHHHEWTIELLTSASKKLTDDELSALLGHLNKLDALPYYAPKNHQVKEKVIAI
jgi:hypothetical protein